MKAIILAGGVGSRISREVNKPKSLLDIGDGMPLLRYTVEMLQKKGIDVSIVLGYKKEDKAASTEITSRQIEIKDFLRRYFTEMTVNDLRPKNEDKRRIEIRNAINDDILSSSKIKDVRFLSLQVIEQ